MFLKQIELFLLICVSVFLLCGCQIHNSTIILKDKTKEKSKIESSVRVENGVIIYKDTKKYDTSKIPKEGDKEEDYIFGK